MVSLLVKIVAVLFFLNVMHAYSKDSIVIPMHCEKYRGELFEARYPKDRFPSAERCMAAGKILYRFRSDPTKNTYGDCKVSEVYLYSTGDTKEMVLLSRVQPNGVCDTEYENYLPIEKNNADQERIFSDIWLTLSDAAGPREFSLNKLSIIDRIFSKPVKTFLRAIKSCNAALGCVNLNSMYKERKFWKVFISVNEERWLLSLGYDGEQMRIYSISDE